MSVRRRAANRRRARGIRGGTSTEAWLPSSLTSLLGWWRADFVEASGSDVTRMTDLSGNGHHLDAAAGFEPQLTASNSDLNSQPTVDFSVADTSYLQPVTNTKADWNALHDGTGSMVLMVLVPRGSTTGFYLATYPINNTEGLALRWVSSAGGSFSDITGISGGFIFNASSGSGTAGAGTGVVFTRIYEEGRTPEQEMGVTGATLATASSSGAPDTDDANRLMAVGKSPSGAATYGEFDLAELIITTAAPSASEEAALTAYTTARYGVAPVWS